MFEIFIVQPGFSKATTNNEILTLLEVTENYLKEAVGVNSTVIFYQKKLKNIK